MKSRDILRTAVMGSNPYWPFSRLNKMPYAVAVKAFVQLCKGFPEIKCAYLRAGLAEGNLIPALSDIDLTVIVHGKLALNQEFTFLRTFWRRYGLLKRFFPMIGEVDVLTDRQLKTWTQFGLRGYEAPHWKLLYGTEVLRTGYSENGRRLIKDCLNDALSFYRGYFREKFSAQEQCSYLTAQDLRRITAKIFRCLRSINPSRPAKSELLATKSNSLEILYQILRGLERGIGHFESGAVSSPRDAGVCKLESSNPVFRGDKRANVAELSRLNGAIVSVLRNYHGRILVVLKSGLNRAELKNCMEALQRVFPLDRPIVLTGSLFTYMLCHYDPFEYGHLMRFREVLFGKDLVPEIQPPCQESILEYLLGQVPNILTFPRSRAVFSSNFSATSFLMEHSVRLVERALILKLYLEKGVVQPWYHELLIECEKRYPEKFVALRTLKERRDGNLLREWFGLLRGLSNDVHNCLTGPCQSISEEFEEEIPANGGR
jgi:hypothetical protein